jgi:hypothetical protein
LSTQEPSILKALGKQLASFKASSGAWLDVQFKVQGAEAVLGGRMHRKSRAFKKAPYREAVERFFGQIAGVDAPELTEVSLATLLKAEGLAFEVTTYAQIYADEALRTRLLTECDCVFASTTLLRDLSEMRPLVAMLKRPHNRVVAGGALGGILHSQWPGCEGLDVLAIGYGEMLVPALAAWIKSDYKTLTPPPTGRVLQTEGTTLLYSGVPESKDLDFLPAPDWALAESYHGRKFRLVHYESVRGCPYRCSFCNYPYLFDDTKFRYRSAARIAEDWARIAALGVEYISCLDSLFTMPKKRLVELCNLLIERDIRVKWVCYARANDLAEIETCELMKRAGCHQVQIGYESGSQAQLDHMNKRNTVEQNQRAIANCRKVGITSLATIIIGFPGETEETLRETFERFKEMPPDIYHMAPFNTRVEYVPILSPESRSRFGLKTVSGGRSSAPYWKHDSMSCTEVAGHVEWIGRRIAEEKIALEGTLFYEGLLGFDARDREALLEFQKDVYTKHPLARRIFSRLNAWVQRKLDLDVARVLAGIPDPAPLPGAAPGRMRPAAKARGAAEAATRPA